MSSEMLKHDDVGTGTPVLLIHGFPLDRSLWRSQIDGLQATARLIAPDLRGFGQSGDPGDTMSMDEYAADLKALVDSLDLRQVVLCGLSMGGYIALAFLESETFLTRRGTGAMARSGQPVR